MKPVILESPYAGEVALNLAYVHRCVLHALSSGEAPFASHLLYTTALDDNDPDGRSRGMAAGHSWRKLVDTCVVYLDRGLSPGMIEGIRASFQLGHVIISRNIDQPKDDGVIERLIELMDDLRKGREP
jgi:hypothetical protein